MDKFDLPNVRSLSECWARPWRMPIRLILLNCFGAWCLWFGASLAVFFVIAIGADILGLQWSNLGPLPVMLVLFPVFVVAPILWASVGISVRMVIWLRRGR